MCDDVSMMIQKGGPLWKMSFFQCYYCWWSHQFDSQYHALAYYLAVLIARACSFSNIYISFSMMAPLAARVGPKQLLPVCKTSALWRSQQRGFADSITNFLLQACDCALQQPSWGLLSLLPFRSSSECAPSSPAHRRMWTSTRRGPTVPEDPMFWFRPLMKHDWCGIYTYMSGRMKSRLVHTQNMQHTPPQRSPSERHPWLWRPGGSGFVPPALFFVSSLDDLAHKAVQDYAALLGLDDNQALARMPSHDMSHAWHVLATWTLRVLIVATGPCR